MVNIYKLKLTILQQEIILLLFVKAGMKLNQRQIANLLGVSQPAVMKAIPKLEQEGFIRIEQDKESKRWSIELDRTNHSLMQLKRAENLRQIYASGFADFLEAEYAGASIILFGSYSRGEDIINSDIDIAVIGRKEKVMDVSKYEKILERQINLNIYESFESIHKNLKENLCNGIMISGGFEL